MSFLDRRQLLAGGLAGTVAACSRRGAGAADTLLVGDQRGGQKVVLEAMALADRILVLDRGRIAAEERIAAPRGQRGAVVRALRASLLGHLGMQSDSGVYADLIGRQP